MSDHKTILVAGATGYIGGRLAPRLLEAGRLLRLRLEVRVPGEAWLEWRLKPCQGGTRLSQMFFFAPRGLPGFLYWCLLKPLRRSTARALLREITQCSEALVSSSGRAKGEKES